MSGGWSRLTPVARDSAAAQPVRHRWGLASRRLCLGAEPLVLRSPVTPSGDDGAGLVHVGSRDPREPHRRRVRWGSPDRLTRFGNRVCAVGNIGDDHLDFASINMEVAQERTAAVSSRSPWTRNGRKVNSIHKDPVPVGSKAVGEVFQGTWTLNDHSTKGKRP